MTPRIIQHRGVQLNNLFRYLQPKSEGEFYLSALPADSHLSNSKINQPDNGQYRTAPYLKRLNKAHSNDFSYNRDRRNFNGWQSSLNLNLVSDDYYFQDFNESWNNVDANQLKNYWRIEKNGRTGMVASCCRAIKHYTRLTRSTRQRPQYQRLPEINLNANYPNVWKTGIHSPVCN